MFKKIVSISLLSYLALFGFCQQPTITELHLNFINENDFFFNKQIINPSILTDTCKLQSDLIYHAEWEGFPDAPVDQTILLNASLPFIEGSIGFITKYSSYSTYNNQMFKLNFYKSFALNTKSEFKAGINFGFSRFRLINDNQSTMLDHSDPYYYTKSNWSYSPNLDLGCTYKYLNHNLGISFLDIIESKYNIYNVSSTYIQRSILVNYFPIIKISKTLNLLPEIIIIRNSGNYNYVINSKIRFKNGFTTGLIYENRYKSYGVAASGIIFKYFDIGYMFDMTLSPIQSHTFGYHSFKLGIIIK